MAVGVERGGALLSFFYRADAGLRHGEAMMPALDWLLQQAALTPAEIELLVCCDGPGSFTGLRIGIAAAKGLSAATDAALVTVSTLDALAWPYRVWPGIVAIAIDARKSRYYAAIYRAGQKLSEDLDVCAATLGQLLLAHAGAAEPLLLAGPAAAQLHSELGDHPHLGHDPDCSAAAAVGLLALGRQKAARGEYAAENHGPHYVRVSDAEMGITTPRRRR